MALSWASRGNVACLRYHRKVAGFAKVGCSGHQAFGVASHINAGHHVHSSGSRHPGSKVAVN
jgi:hypothetical protein